MNVTPEKKAANRRNSQKSTGPKTIPGKQNVKFNALKHGLCAKEVLIDKGPGRENRAEFNELFRELLSEFPPADFLEKIALEELQVQYWRKRRVLRCENARIRQQMKNIKDVHHDRLASGRLSTFKITPLMEVISQLQETKVFSQSLAQKLASALGTRNKLVRYCKKFEPTGHAKSEIDVPLSSSQFAKILARLELELDWLKYKRGKYFEDKRNYEGDLAANSVPFAEIAENLRRYETGINRNLNRAMDQIWILKTTKSGARSQTNYKRPNSVSRAKREGYLKSVA